MLRPVFVNLALGKKDEGERSNIVAISIGNSSNLHMLHSFATTAFAWSIHLLISCLWRRWNDPLSGWDAHHLRWLGNWEKSLFLPSRHGLISLEISLSWYLHRNIFVMVRSLLAAECRWALNCRSFHDNSFFFLEETPDTDLLGFFLYFPVG